jgi:hypothetical protein
MFTVGANLTRVDAAAQHKLGSIYEDNAGKRYKYLLFAKGTANLSLAAGDVAFYVDDTGYEASTCEADNSDATGQPLGAGVALATITDGQYGWYQTRGLYKAINVALGGSAGDGDPLTVKAAADKGLTKAAEADSTGVYKAVCAYAVDASDKDILCAFTD